MDRPHVWPLGRDTVVGAVLFQLNGLALELLDLLVSRPNYS